MNWFKADAYSLGKTILNMCRLSEEPGKPDDHINELRHQGFYSEKFLDFLSRFLEKDANVREDIATLSSEIPTPTNFKRKPMLNAADGLIEIIESISHLPSISLFQQNSGSREASDLNEDTQDFTIDSNDLLNVNKSLCHEYSKYIICPARGNDKAMTLYDVQIRQERVQELDVNINCAQFVCLPDNRIFICNTYLNGKNAYIFSLLTSQLSQVAKSMYNRHWTSGSRIGSTIYSFFGWDDAANEGSRLAEMYNLEADEWRTLPEIPWEF